MTVPLDTVNDIRSMDAAGRSMSEIARVGSVEKVGVAPEPKRVCPASGNLEYGDILCRLDPVRKLEAGLYHLPGLRLKLGPVYPPFDSAPAPLVVVSRKLV